MVGMSENENYRGGDEITISGVTITLTSRKGSHGVRWSWRDRLADIEGQSYHGTPQEAIADAERTLAAPSCRHGFPTTQFCPNCHDSYEI